MRSTTPSPCTTSAGTGIGNGSGFATPVGRSFHHATVRALAPLAVPRIVTLKIDGRPVAFHYYLVLEGRMYVYRIAFDPSFGRLSPGVINTLDAIETAAAEGATRVEFLRRRRAVQGQARGGPPGAALPGPRAGLHAQGEAAVAARVGGIRMRMQLKRSPALRRFYFEGLAPARRMLGRLT